jgi:hypothetical protein
MASSSELADRIGSIPQMLEAKVAIALGVPVLSFQLKSRGSTLYRRHFAALKLAERYRLSMDKTLKFLRIRLRGWTNSRAAGYLKDEAKARLKSYGRNDYIAAAYAALAGSQVALSWLVS